VITCSCGRISICI